MHAHVKFPHVLSHVGATDTCMALGTHEVAQSNNHLLDLVTKKRKKKSNLRESNNHDKTQENDISIVKYLPATPVVTTDNDNKNYRSIRKYNPQEMNLVVLCTKDAQK